MIQKWTVSMWLTGTFVPSIVSVLVWMLQSLGLKIVLPGSSVYLDFFAALVICIAALCLWRIGWRRKLLAAVVSVLCLLGQLVILGVLAMMHCGLNGIQ